MDKQLDPTDPQPKRRGFFDRPASFDFYMNVGGRFWGGMVMGAGAGLALLCDTIVMGETASIGFPFPRVGLAPDFAVANTLPQAEEPALAR